MPSTYTIISVTFVSTDKTEVTQSQEIDGQVVITEQVRTTYLHAQVSFKSTGFPDDQQGFCEVEICKICDVTIDQNGNLTNFTQYPEPSSSDVMDAINASVEDKMNSLIYATNEQSYTRSFLANMNADPDYPKDPPYVTHSPFIYPDFDVLQI